MGVFVPYKAMIRYIRMLAPVANSGNERSTTASLIDPQNLKAEKHGHVLEDSVASMMNNDSVA